MWLLWVLVILSALAGGLVVFAGVATGAGAPQEAAAAAVGLALAVIPYVIVRAIAACFALSRRSLRKVIVEALRESREETLRKLRPPQ
jgi:hypothetical protein